MKIAFIVKYFPTVSETFIVNQINGLIDAGVDVQLFSYNNTENIVTHKSLKKHKLNDKVEYFIKSPKNKFLRLALLFKWVFNHFFKISWRLFFKSINVFKYGKEAYTLKLFYESQWFLIPYDFEIIHSHFGMNGNRIAYLKSKRIIPSKVKLINTFHGYDLMPSKLNEYKKEYHYLFNNSNAFTVNTQYLEGLLLQVNYKNLPCFILPVGLDTTFFKRRTKKVKNGKFNIVFCGKLISLKGPDLAIEIISGLNKLGYNQVQLHFIGDGVLRNDLKKKVKDFQLLNQVFFHGSQSQKDLLNHLELADVFLLPGRIDPITKRVETQGLVIQEAQAMELPVIVSDVGGMKYGLLQDKSGFVIKEGKIMDFIAAIEKLILNPKLKTNMGIEGRKFIKDNYDMRILTKRLLEIYSKVL